MLEKIKTYYSAGLWDIDRLFNVVGKVISEQQYFEITGFTYPNKE